MNLDTHAHCALMIAVRHEANFRGQDGRCEVAPLRRVRVDVPLKNLQTDEEKSCYYQSQKDLRG
jgi:hypothetical protein